MRNLALLSAALLPLLGGCVSNTCDYPTATISWRLQDANGGASTCAEAGVTDVDVYFNGTPVGPRFACTASGAVIDLGRIAPGTYQAIVEGTGADGTIWNRSNPFTVTVSDCGDRRYAPVLGEGWLDVDYHFGAAGSAGDVCHGGAIWYGLYDEVANFYISGVDFNTVPVGPDYVEYRDYYGCYTAASGATPATGRPLQIPLPFGTYTLAWIQEVFDPLSASHAAVQQACVQPPFHLTSAGISSMPVTMGPYSAGTPACPVYP
jgi:hypothetical protein